LTGKKFFPNLIQSPFHHGLIIVFVMAIAMAVVGAIFSALRGKRYIFPQESLAKHAGDLAESSGSVPGEIAYDAEVAR
jgi:hypothetical protein